MATTFSRKSEILDGTVTVTFNLTAKDEADDALVRKYGDVIINVTGYFVDPADGTYPKFYVNAGDPIELFQAGTFTAHFEDSTMLISALQKRADLWGDNIQTQIQNGILALRAFTDTISGTTTVTI